MLPQVVDEPSKGRYKELEDIKSWSEILTIEK